MLASVVIYRRHFILSGMGEGHRQLARSARYAHFFAFQPLTVRRSVTLLESTLEKVPHKTGLTTFRINTCKSGSKQRTLTTFRMNRVERSLHLCFGWVEDSVVRSDSRGFGVAEASSKCGVASIVW